MTVAAALWIVTGLYAALALVAAWGLRARAHAPACAPETPPEAVVIVAARNEAHALPRCLAALATQTHPRLHVVVANDGSTDETGDVARAAGGDALTVLDVPQDDASPVRGKARALAYATAHVRQAHPNALLLFTDADCTPPPGWASALATRLAAQPRAGVLGAGAFVRPHGSLGAAQTLDWALGAGVAAGLSGLGWTASAMGNNLACTPEAYDATGGFAALGASVTEDHALVQAIAASGRTAAYRLDAALTLDTEPVPTFGALLAQRHRWARGGLAGGPAVWMLYGLVWSAHVALVGALASGAWTVAGLKLAADALVLARVQRGLGRRLPWAWFGLFQLVLTAYVLVTPLRLAAPVVWKGRRM